ncbi:Polyadenylate-binding protein-interacting protein 13 [Raphanus sativus]|uniref:Polyadenylate-binding protein-interacting protein 13-like n=1 Tax=Raphanus sativus TaxID=3726 RepID=A0A6J0L3M4_RAPSA|nr:polyadenylate-binding protein-interacting protein 13-like [Raphanus sativus]KAJ4877541.1 Polyadenylate-binding protein-interacting protein 13 [Raphanus sativus]
MIMAVPENADVKDDSSGQNLDNNAASLPADTMMPPCPDDQNPESNSSVETPNSTKGSEGALKNEISHSDVKFSKLNAMAKEYVPQLRAPTHPGFVNNMLWFTNNFAMQTFFIDDYDLFATTRINFGQRKRRMSRKTSLAQKEDVIRRTVHVLDINQQATEEKLAGLFQSCGQVVDCRICGDNKSIPILRFAFIEFTDEEGARSALSLSGTLFGSHPIKVRLSKTAIAPVNPGLLPKSEEEREKCARTVYCTNIDKKVTQMELEDFFKEACGEIQHLKLVGDCHHQTCIAFVEFKLVESAVSALNCSGIVLGGFPVRVSPSKTPVRLDPSDRN